MSKKKVDLSGIKEKELDKTSSFTDLMTKKEKKNRYNISSDDIDDMVKEKRKHTEDLRKELEKAKKQYKEEFISSEKNDNLEENLAKTQILELTRAMKFNFEEKKEENKKKKKHGISPLNIVGELNLLCIGYYIYLLGFTNYQDIEIRYVINGSIIILMVLLFGLSVVTSKKISKFFHLINILTIVSFVVYNIYTLIA